MLHLLFPNTSLCVLQGLTSDVLELFQLFKKKKKINPFIPKSSKQLLKNSVTEIFRFLHCRYLWFGIGQTDGESNRNEGKSRLSDFERDDKRTIVCYRPWIKSCMKLFTCQIASQICLNWNTNKLLETIFNLCRAMFIPAVSKLQEHGLINLVYHLGQVSL